MALEAASVVIPSWNGAAILGPTLKHLTRLTGVEFEVLVVDHGRLNRDTEALMKDLDPRFRYVGLDEQLGYAGAVNHGSALARNRLVAVLCNDVLVEPDWLAELVKKQAGSGAAVVSSLVRRPGFDEPLGARLNLWGRIVPSGPAPENAEDYVPFFPDGSAFLFDKGRLGMPFDADYFLYLEDVSLGWRAWLMGERVTIAPLSRALNADGGTTRRTPYKTAFFTERNRWLSYFSYLSCRSLALSLPPLALDAIFRLIAGSNRLAKLHAWAWIFFHPALIWGKRREKLKLRRRPDSEILSLISGRYLGNGGALDILFRAYFRIVGLPYS
ncbi:MAG: glycosyltransferase family 2 protein [Bdellovibrionota bacterium]